jgi:hypothetical protein
LDLHWAGKQRQPIFCISWPSLLTQPQAGAKIFKEKPDGPWTPEQVADYLYEKMGKNEFYIICPDNDVSEEMDRKRMTWAAGDVVQRRPPLSRWREEWKQEAEETMARMDV